MKARHNYSLLTDKMNRRQVDIDNDPSLLEEEYIIKDNMEDFYKDLNRIPKSSLGEAFIILMDIIEGLKKEIEELKKK